MIRYLGYASIALLCCSCSGIKKQSSKPIGRSFQISKVWARHTLNDSMQSTRGKHRMKTLFTKKLVVQGNGVDGIRAYKKSTGFLKWERSIDGGVEAGASIAGNTLYFGGNDGFFYAVDVNSGKTRWVFPLRAEALGEPFVYNDVVYFVSGNNTVYALKAHTGEQVWFYTRKDGANLTIRGTSRPTVFGDNLIVGFSDGALVSLDRRKGTLRWEKFLGDSRNRFKDVDAHPVLVKDKLLVPSYDGKLYLIQAATGKVLWSVESGGFQTPLVQAKQVYVATSMGEVRAHDLSSGKLLWKHKLRRGVATSPTYYRGLILFGEWDGDFVALDSAKGNVIGRYSTGRGVTSSPSVDGETDLTYMMGTDGDLYAFRIGWVPNNEVWEWEKSPQQSL